MFEVAGDVFARLHKETRLLTTTSFPCKTGHSASLDAAMNCASAVDGISSLSTYFSFIERSEVVCDSPTSYVSRTLERQFMLLCPPKRSLTKTLTLQELITSAFARGDVPKDFDIGAKKLCVGGYTQTVMCSSPSYLWVNLGRGAQNPTTGKLFKYTFSVNLTQTVQIPIYKFEATPDKSEVEEYTLTGICIHSGTTFTTGHWVAYTLVNGAWYLFDDANTPVKQTDFGWSTVGDIQQNVSFVLLQKIPAKLKKA